MKKTLLMALTLDGKIGESSDHFPDWTEKADKQLFKSYTKEAAVFVIGRKTFDTMGRALPGRLNVVMTRTPKESKEKDLWFTDLSPKELIKDLEKKGFEEVVIAGGQIVNTLFIKENLIDEILVTISPKLFGKGLSLFDETVALDLELLEVQPIGENTIQVRYKIVL